MLTDTSSLVMRDFNAHHSVLHSGTTDTRDNQLADSVNISSFTVLNTDTPTMLPGEANPSSPDVSAASASLITLSEWQTHTTMSSDHLPILMGFQTTATSCPTRHGSYINLKKAVIARKTVVLSYTIEAASHHIATGRRRLHNTTSPIGDLSHDGGTRRPTPAGSCLVDNE